MMFVPNFIICFIKGISADASQALHDALVECKELFLPPVLFGIAVISFVFIIYFIFKMIKL